MNRIIPLTLLLVALVACTSAGDQPDPGPVATDTPQANLPNPASFYCEQQGYRLEIRTATDGSQYGICVFPDGSECEEWAYYRGECLPREDGELYGHSPDSFQNEPGTAGNSPANLPTAIPIDPAHYQGWWTYTQLDYGFSIQLPEDWVVEETTTFDPLMNDHTLNLHSREIAPGQRVDKENIRLTFRRIGEDARLWPTGVGQGEFIPQGTLTVAGQPAQRLLLVCPTGEITAIWYHQAEGQPNITRGDLEFGFIFSAAEHCEAGYSLSGKSQLLGEMIIASLSLLE